jgi:hypothetical protein
MKAMREKMRIKREQLAQAQTQAQTLETQNHVTLQIKMQLPEEREQIEEEEARIDFYK